MAYRSIEKEHRQQPTFICDDCLAVVLMALRAIIFLIASVATATASQTSAPLYIIGASETLGFGLNSGELAYPELLRRKCGTDVHVIAAIALPIADESLPLLNSRTDVVVFFGLNDALAAQADANYSDNLWRIFRQLRLARHVIIILEPPSRDLPAMGHLGSNLAIATNELEHKIRIDAKRARLTNALYVPRIKPNLISADGLHPNRLGQAAIAHLIVEGMPPGFCSNLAHRFRGVVAK